MGQRVRALEALQRAAAISNTAELRREAVAALTLPDLRLERDLPIAGDATFFELDAGFERYAICRGSGPMEIHAVSDHRLLASLPASGNFPAYYGKWSADGKYLAFKRDRTEGALHADVEVWEVANARRVLLVPDLTLGAMAFHPRQPRLLTGRQAGVTLWDLETGQEVKSFELPTTAPRRLQFSPEGDQFAALCNSEKQHTLSVN